MMNMMVCGSKISKKKLSGGRRGINAVVNLEKGRTHNRIDYRFSTNVQKINKINFAEVVRIKKIDINL